jgi:hypothetical protein
MNTYSPEPFLVLASMFFHFEPDNDQEELEATRSEISITTKTKDVLSSALSLKKEFYYMKYSVIPSDIKMIKLVSSLPSVAI